MNRILLRLIILIAGVAINAAALAQDPSDSTVVSFVDSAGQPVENVRAYFYNGKLAKKLESKSGSATVEASDGIVAAVADGFQYSGTILSNDPAQVVLMRDDEPYPPINNRPFPLTAELKKQFKEKLESKLWEELENNPNRSPVDIQQAMRILGRWSPAKSLKFLNEQDLNSQMKTAAQQPIIAGFLESDVESAMQLIDEIKNPMFRAMSLGAILKELPAKHSAMSVIEKQMVDSLREVKQPGLRLMGLSALAQHYADTDRTELAQKIVDRHLEEAKKLPADGLPGFARSLFAALVAEKNIPLALSLIEGGKDENEQPRAEARVAFYACRTHPQQAIELLDRSSRNPNLITYFDNHIKLSHRMAVEQTEAAIKLVELIDEPNQQAWGYGMMAMRLKASNPELAKDLLNRAIVGLDQAKPPTTWSRNWHSPSMTLAGLLPVAQDVCPEQVRSMIWQSVFHGIPKSRWVDGLSNQMKLQIAAGGIARYDVALAKALMTEKKIKIDRSYGSFAAHQFLIDPNGIGALIERGLESNERHHVKKQLASVLNCDEATFWKMVSKPMMLEWPTERFEEH